MQISILKKEQINAKLSEQVNQLFEELNSNIEQMSLTQVLQNEEAIIFVVAADNNQLAGMASMAIYKVISGHKGMIEDVVVSKQHRGKGIGRKLMNKLLLEAKNRKLSEVLLFSGHHREAAINLYKSLGFNLKNSGLYRLKVD